MMLTLHHGVLSILVVSVTASLKFDAGTLDGTEYNYERGLSDKQLALLRTFSKLAEVRHQKSLKGRRLF